MATWQGERVGEGAVGYAVRGESRQSPGVTSLLFCTTGVLLRMLEEDATLSNVTHVLVDEVCPPTAATTLERLRPSPPPLQPSPPRGRYQPLHISACFVFDCLTPLPGRYIRYTGARAIGRE